MISAGQVDKPGAVLQAAISEAELLLTDSDAKSFTSMKELRDDLLTDEDDNACST